MSLSDLQNISSLDALSTINRPDGNGFWICGQAASRKLFDMAISYLSESNASRQIDAEKYASAVERLIATRFLLKGAQISEKSVTRILSTALKYSNDRCQDFVHYFPVHITSDNTPPEFSIGPVIFRPRHLFMDALMPRFEEYVSDTCALWAEGRKKDRSPLGVQATETTLEDKSNARMFVDETISWFGEFGWVAEVKVSKCDPETSRERAILVVEGALNLLRVMLSASFSQKIRLGGSQGLPQKSSNLSADSSGKLEISLSRGSVAQHLGPQWWDVMRANVGERRFAIAGRLLHAIADVSTRYPLCERIFDALTWYGQAVVDQHTGSRIVKYMNAVERITVCEERDNVTNTISERAAALCFDPDKNNFQYWVQYVRHIYAVRSDLVHGTKSPFDAELLRENYNAECTSRFVIIQSLLFFERLNIKANMSTRSLRENFVQYVNAVKNFNLSHW